MLKIFTPLLLLFLTYSCNNDLDEVSNNPSNLTVDITKESETGGKIFVVASAENASHYELYIDSSEEPAYDNTSGRFEHTFEEEGIYDLAVRAYNDEGRYIKETGQVIISFDGDITPDDGYTSPPEYEGYELIWNDEFNGNSVNTDNWKFETGAGGWGNNELQYYTADNASVEDGMLTIQARHEANYTSARMITQGKFSFKYGRVDIRALLPEGQGIWPALWMLGSNFSSVGWPTCGEIDIMEMIGGSGRENTVHGTLHWDVDGHASTGGSYELQNGTFADEYHVFSIVWNESTITWYVNNSMYHEIDISPDHMTEFRNEFFFIFNVAVGGNWPGYPDNTTVFPQSMKVDYIRVFQEN
jgi:hypothetical protein